MSPSRDERAQAKRRQILDAARTRFLRDGVAETSVDSIRVEAGVSKQTIYSYFDDKDALLRAVLESLVEERIADMTVHPDTLPISSIDELRTALISLASRAAKALTQPDYLATARVVIHETVRQPEFGRAFADTVATPVLKAVQDTLRRARQGGALTTDPSRESPRLLVGGILTYTLLDGLLRPTDVRPPTRRQLANLVDEYLSGLPKAPDG